MFQSRILSHFLRHLCFIVYISCDLANGYFKKKSILDEYSSIIEMFIKPMLKRKTP